MQILGTPQVHRTAVFIRELIEKLGKKNLSSETGREMFKSSLNYKWICEFVTDLEV